MPSRLAGDRPGDGRFAVGAVISPTTANTRARWPVGGGPVPCGFPATTSLEVLALLGVEPVWDEALRRVVDLELIDPAELGRPASTSRSVSRVLPRRLPHVVTMLDDAVAPPRPPTSPMNRTSSPPTSANQSLAEHGDDRRAHLGIRPSPAPTAPACCSSSTAAVASDEDLAAVYTAWAATRTDADSTVVRRSTTCAAYRRINVAAKNTDTCEHDIADPTTTSSTTAACRDGARAHRLRIPRPYIGDSTPGRRAHAHAVGGGDARLPGPRSTRADPAMQRHGCGPSRWPPPSTTFSATTPRPTSSPTGCTEQLTQSYVLDEANREFLDKSNPWALHGITERLPRGRAARPVGVTAAGDARRTAPHLPADRGRHRGRAGE